MNHYACNNGNFMKCVVVDGVVYYVVWYDVDDATPKTL